MSTKYKLVLRGNFRNVTVAFSVELLKPFRLDDPVLDREPRHQAACALRMKTHDLVHPGLSVLEHALHDPCRKL